MKNKKLLLIILFALSTCLIYKEDILGATEISVSNYNELKTYCETSGDYIIYLNNDITIENTINIVGNKTINGNNHYLNNYLSEYGNVVSGSHNSIFIANSGSNCTLNSCQFNGRNITSGTSSILVLYSGATVNVNSSVFLWSAFQGIHVGSGGVLNFNSGTISAVKQSAIGSLGTVYFRNGTIGSDAIGLLNGGGTMYIYGGSIEAVADVGVRNENGTVTMEGGVIKNVEYGVQNLGTGIVFNLKSGEIKGCTVGVHAQGGKLNISGSSIHDNVNGVEVENYTITNVSGGKIYNNTNGIATHSSTLNISGGSVYSNTSWGVTGYNSSSITITSGEIYSNHTAFLTDETTSVYIKGGTLYSNRYAVNNYGRVEITGGTIRDNTGTDGPGGHIGGGTCLITAGEFESDQFILLDGDSLYVETKTSYPVISIKPNTYTRGRVIVKTSDNTYAEKEIENVTLIPNSNWKTRVSGANIVLWEWTNVTAKYQDTDGNTIADDVVTEGWAGASYTTAAKSITGYTLKTVPSNSTGTYAGENITVTYVYESTGSEIEIQYIDEISGDVLATITEEGIIGDSYTTQAKEFDGYKLITEPENKEITFSEEKITVTYGYRKISEGVEIKYINQETGEELLTSELIEGVEGAEYTSSSKEIDGYDLVVIPENANGTMTVEKITVTYEYLLIEGKIIITKVDRNDESKVLSGATFKIEKLDDDNNIDSSYTATELITDANGKVEFTDLVIGKYRITEIKAPEGYELSEDVIDIEITSENKEINIIVTDRLKLELPKTGGRILIFYSSGTILIMLSAILCMKLKKKLR